VPLHCQELLGGTPLNGSQFGDKMARTHLILVLLAAATISACSTGKDTRAAEQVVARFREQMSAAALGDIYDAASSEWQKSTSRSDSEVFLAAVNRKLGGVKTASRTGWQDSYNTSGHIVTLRYHTEFERGAGDETFTVRLEGGRGQLVGYHINSNAMMIN
jgi:hypothetical protein